MRKVHAVLAGGLLSVCEGALNTEGSNSAIVAEFKAAAALVESEPELRALSNVKSRDSDASVSEQISSAMNSLTRGNPAVWTQTDGGNLHYSVSNSVNWEKARKFLAKTSVNGESVQWENVPCPPGEASIANGPTVKFPEKCGNPCTGSSDDGSLVVNYIRHYAVVSNPSLKDAIVHELDESIPVLSVQPGEGWNEYCKIHSHLAKTEYVHLFLGSGFALNENDPRNIARAAAAGIELLKKLHSLGIVRSGPGNVRIKAKNKVVDWSDPSAMVIDNMNNVRLFVNPVDKVHNDPRDLGCANQVTLSSQPSLSPGELFGFCPTRFDDLYRLCEDLFTGAGFQRGVPTDGDLLARGWINKKRNYRISPSSLRHIVAPIAGSEKVYAVMNAFHREMFQRSFERSVDVPDYDHWINEFMSVAV